MITDREDTFYSLVWWPKASSIFPLTEASLIKDIESINIVLPNAFTGTLHELEVSFEHAVMGYLTIFRSEVAKQQPRYDLKDDKEHCVHEA